MVNSNFLYIVSACICAGALQARDTTLLDQNWKFFFGDTPYAQEEYCEDATWETVNVPHDWAIDKNFDISIDRQRVKVIEDGDENYKIRTGRTGALPCFGKGWYRKSFEMPKSAEGERIFLEFDGAMSRAKVYINGQYIDQWPYGYASFCIDITSAVKFGQKNIVAVSLDNPKSSSRWYSGAGLYRNVRLVRKSPVHIDYNGISVFTSRADGEIGAAQVRAELKSFSNAKKATVKMSISDKDNKILATQSQDVDLNGGEAESTQKLEIKNPKLWSVESPNLYFIKTQVFVEGKEVDSTTTRFGFRTIKFDKDNGFSLNGKRVDFKGVCMHHDLGPLGAAVNVRATERQIEILKEMGCNAIRISHNPPSPEFLDLCDEMGILVMDEAFDEWKDAKCDNGYNKLWDDWAEKDIESFIKRDRNHPSVVIWSIGNEVRELMNKTEGAKRAVYLRDLVRKFDSSRPVTSGLHRPDEAFDNGVAQELDIVGFNYKPHLYAKYRKEFPNMPFYGSETASTVSTRGQYYPSPKREKKPYHDDLQVCSYDLESAPWATTPDEEWEAQDTMPWLFGEFVWTGFDYLGEPYPYDVNSIARSSYFGIVDLAGLPKDRFYLYQSRWNENKKVLHILPHWNWEGYEGKTVPVFCYTNYPKVELFLNGKSQGVREKIKDSKNVHERYRMMWNDVKYEAGELKAVAYDKDGKK